MKRNPCCICKHREPSKGGFICEIRDPWHLPDNGNCLDFTPDPNNKTEPGANCDLYGKACMTCPGCPAETPTEEDVSEVWG